MCDDTLMQCYNNYTDKSIWSTIPDRSFVDIGLFPNHLMEYKNQIKDLRNIFKLKQNLVMEAQERWLTKDVYLMKFIVGLFRWFLELNCIFIKKFFQKMLTSGHVLPSTSTLSPSLQTLEKQASQSRNIQDEIFN